MSKQNKPSRPYKQKYQLSPNSNQSPELYHFGVKGMRWGVRKASPSGSGTKSYNSSRDYNAANRLRRKAKQSGAKSLTNKEMKMVNTRLELEKKYNALNPSALDKGQRALSATVTIVGGVTALYAASKSPLANDVKKLFEKKL